MNLIRGGVSDPLFEAEKNGTLPEYYFKKLIYFRDEFRDDLPNEDVRNSPVTIDKDGRRSDNYKCRGNYIVGLSITLEALVRKKIIVDPDIIKKINEFRNHDFNFIKNKFTTKEEINMINQILSDTISHLKNKLNIKT